jgi:RNA polymerase sigma factor (TIGR02999 family)
MGRGRSTVDGAARIHPSPRMSDVTQILSQIESGDPSAAEQLLPLVYEELRKLAAVRLAQEKPGQTLQATALVHDAYIRLVDVEKAKHWNSRGHFFGAAAEAMRRILVENARRKGRVRHGHDMPRVELPDVAGSSGPSPETILAVDEAVSRLRETDPATANIVQMHFFAGLTLDEVADALGVSRATVYRQWSYARAVLRLALSGEAP